MTRLLLSSVFGQSAAAFTTKNNEGKTALVVAWFCKHGFTFPRKVTAKALDVSEDIVWKTVSRYRGEIESLLNDAKELGYTSEAVANMIAHPTLEDTVRRFTTQLRELRVKRSETGNPGPLLNETWERFVEEAWFEHRVNGAYQGHPADEYEVKPPLWFRREMAEVLNS